MTLRMRLAERRTLKCFENDVFEKYGGSDTHGPREVCRRIGTEKVFAKIGTERELPRI